MDIIDLSTEVNKGTKFQLFPVYEEFKTPLFEWDNIYDPDKVDQRWVRCNTNIVSKSWIDIIHQIKTPIDTVLTINGSCEDICTISLKKNVPYTLNFPVMCTTFTVVKFNLSPATFYDYTAIFYSREDPYRKKLLKSVIIYGDLYFSQGIIRPISTLYKSELWRNHKKYESLAS